MVMTYKKSIPCRLNRILLSINFQCLLCFPPLPYNRTTTTNSGGFLASHVAGETTHNSHAHQPRGEQQDQVSTILARVWEEAVWTIHSGHYRPADTG